MLSSERRVLSVSSCPCASAVISTTSLSFVITYYMFKKHLQYTVMNQHANQQNWQNN